MPVLARFVPVLSSVGALRLLEVSFGLPIESLPSSTRRFERATRFRAAAHQAAAGEILAIRASASEVRNSRRTLTIPLVVVSGARGADSTWRDLQRDQVTLSTRGCQIIAEQSGHVVPLDRPDIVVDAIRAIVSIARRGDEVFPCGSVARGTR